MEYANVLSFLTYCVIVTFTPGPTNIVLMSSVYNLGVKQTMSYVYGATMAFILLLSAFAIAGSMLLALHPSILHLLQLIGGAYTLYLAYQIYNAGKAPATQQQQVFTVWDGLLMQLLNPKVMLFTMTVIPSFVMPYDTSAVGLALAISTVTVIAFSAMMTWVLFGAVFKGFLHKYQKTVNLLMGTFLLYSAFMMLLK